MSKHTLLTSIARRLNARETDRDLGYPQTWWYVARLRRLMPIMARLIQSLCGIWGGHEWSRTEYGYGGKGIDRWCRWCNRRTIQPKAECDIPQILADLMPEVDDPAPEEP